MSEVATHDRDIAVLQTRLEVVMNDIAAIKEEGAIRDQKRSEDMRRIISEFDSIRSEMAKQQGFLNGAAFVIKGFWAAVGASAIGIIGWLLNGAPPLK